MDANQGFGSFLNGVASPLRAHGFTRRGSAFRRESSGAVELVTYQKSRHSTRSSLSFTVNLGVSLEVLKFHGVRDASIHDCPWRIRLGRFLHPDSDRWWDIDESTDVDSLIAEHRTFVDTVISPKLAEMSSSERLIELWQAGQAAGLTEGQRRVYLAVLLECRGREGDSAEAGALVALGVPALVYEFEDVLDPHLERAP